MKHDSIVYCANCGEATTRLEAKLRRFNTGSSACCDDNLIARRPMSRWGKVAPRIIGALRGKR